MLRAGDDDIARVRNEVAVNILVDARFDNAIAERRFDAGNNHCLIAVEQGQNFKDILRILDLSVNLKAFFKVNDFANFT